MTQHKTFGLLLTTAAIFAAQASVLAQDPSLAGASEDIRQQLEQSVTKLTQLQDRIAAEKTPLNEELARLEAELAQVKLERDEVTGAMQARALEVVNLDGDLKNLEATNNYLTNQLGGYLREFEAQLHIVELDRFSEQLEAVKLAPEDDSNSRSEIYALQSQLLATSIERALDVVGGTIFEGTAVDPDGAVKDGAFVLVGPTATFRSTDLETVGTAEQRLGSLKPRVTPFPQPLQVDAAIELVSSATGTLPLDPTLGNAHKVESTKETFFEHAEKGGAVMWPLAILAGLALLVAIWKWLSLTFLRRPSRGQVDALIAAVEEGDEEAAVRKASGMKGPIGRMLARGASHLREPRELIEEVMYEKMLQAKLGLQSMLPFIAICAAAAPLLGLLGTVIGIIETFKLITVYGSGDVKSLSSGISTALITTEFGLIVAIPALLLHAYLSRKARSVVGAMETTALAFANAVGRSPFGRRRQKDEVDTVEIPRPDVVAADSDLIRSQVTEVLTELLGPLAGNGPRRTVAGVGSN